MSAIARTWIAFAAVGTGLIHVALVIGSPLALGIPLAILGVVEFGWGILAFTRDELPFARAAMVVAVAPLVAWGLLVAAASALQFSALAAVLDVVPWGIAAIFQLFVAGTLARHTRRVRDGKGTAASAPGAGPYLTVLIWVLSRFLPSPPLLSPPLRQAFTPSRTASTTATRVRVT